MANASGKLQVESCTLTQGSRSITLINFGLQMSLRAFITRWHSVTQFEWCYVCLPEQHVNWWRIMTSHRSLGICLMSSAWYQSLQHGFCPLTFLFPVMNGHLLLFIDSFLFLGSKNDFKLWLRNAIALCGFVLVCLLKIVWEENTIILLILITSNHLRIESECFNVALWLYEPQIKLELDNITFDFSVRGNWAIAAAHIGTSKRKSHRRVNGGHRRSFKQMNPI